jgi:hypothetical protein
MRTVSRYSQDFFGPCAKRGDDTTTDSRSKELSCSAEGDRWRLTLANLKYIDIFTSGLVLLGITLRLCQFFANSSLWLDEVLLSSNIVGRPMGDLLLHPLSYDQVAPKGFLLIEKVATTFFGRSEYALRLFPLLCSLLGLLVFLGVAKRLLEGLAVPIAVALFACAPPLITFSAEVKQYSTDVAVAVCLLWLSIGLTGPQMSKRRAFLTGAGGGIAVWFSQPAVFSVIGCGVSLALIAVLRPPKGRTAASWRFLLPLAIWTVSAVLAARVALASMTPETRMYMQQFWESGMLPSPAWRALQIHWPWNMMKALVGQTVRASLAYPHPGVYLLAAAGGFWLIWRRHRSLVSLLLMPAAVTLAAAITRQYPFSDRLILFLVPFLFLPIAVLIAWIAEHPLLHPLVWKSAVVFLFVAPTVRSIASTPPPYRIEDIKPVMAYLQTHKRTRDAVYVYYGAGPAFSFYSKDYGFAVGDYRIGNSQRCHATLHNDVDELRGNPRVWIVVTHAVPAYHDWDEMLQYLETIGVARDRFSVPAHLIGTAGLPAELLLYDLSSPFSGHTSASWPLIPQGFTQSTLTGACQEDSNGQSSGWRVNPR